MMKVGEWMSRQVQVCRVGDTLNDAAYVFWTKDRGWIPVLDPSDRLVGVVTDRDVCMGAHFTGRPLAEVRVTESMVRQVKTCKATEELAQAACRMGDHRVRRLPVVDDEGRLVGVLALADVARAAVHGKSDKERHDLSAEVARIVAAVSSTAQQPPKDLVVLAAARKEPIRDVQRDPKTASAPVATQREPAPKGAPKGAPPKKPGDGNRPRA